VVRVKGLFGIVDRMWTPGAPMSTYFLPEFEKEAF
jgi:hypothetical protein